MNACASGPRKQSPPLFVCMSSSVHLSSIRAQCRILGVEAGVVLKHGLDQAVLRETPTRLMQQSMLVERALPVKEEQTRVCRPYRSPASIVSLVVFPLLFSSRLIRVTAAETPMTTAKMGSATLEMMYVGAGIFSRLASRCARSCSSSCV